MNEQKFAAAAAALVSALVYVEYDQFVKKLDSPKKEELDSRACACGAAVWSCGTGGRP